MKKAYLLVYSHAFGSREAVKEYLNSMDDIETWRYDMPHCFYIVSEKSAGQLARQLIDINGGKGRFLVSEMTGNEEGLLTEASWDLIENKNTPRKVRTA